MKLIVGLGNPGKEYQKTRHNIGFDFLDFYLSKKQNSVVWSNKFEGKSADINLNGERVIFFKPQTYMNLSGNAVSKIMNYYHIEISDLLVICDDLDLSVGNFKLRDKGSCGGHNGLRNIEENIHTQEYKRLKIGISKDSDMNTKDYVLGSFSKEDREVIEELFETLSTVLDDYFSLSFADLMNRYNRKNR